MTLTSLKGERRDLPSARIMEVKKVPDTLIVLSNGSCMMVKESLEEVLTLFAEDARLPRRNPCLFPMPA